jgi:outer membrane protein W
MALRLRGGFIIALLLAGFAAPAPASDLTGMAAVGLRAGGALFDGGLNYVRNDPADPARTFNNSISPRLTGDLVFSYVWSDHITFDLTTGWSWSRIKSDAPGANDSFYVATSVPIVLGARFLARDNQPWRPYLGVGGGVYWWSVLTQQLGPAVDPSTFARFRRAVPGVYGTAGVEKRFSKHMTGSGDLVYHYMFSKDEQRWPSGFNGNKSYMELRLGLNFFFSVSERIETSFPE